RADADLRIDMHRTAGLVRDAIHLRQPKAGAFAGRFGREERIEGACEHLWLHACAVVLDLDAHVLARREFTSRLLDASKSGRERDATAVIGDRVARVEDEIEDRQLELVWVA